MATQTLRVPALGADGRLPDAYAPQATLDAATAAQDSASTASQQAGIASTAAQTATDKATAASTAAQTATDKATAASGSAATATSQALNAAAARDATEQTVTAGLTWTGAVDLASLVTGPVYLRSTLTGNVTLTLPTPSAARAFTVTLDLQQDTTGSRLLVIKNAGTSYAVPIALQIAANSRDIVHLMWTGADWVALLGAPAVGIPTSWIVS